MFKKLKNINFIFIALLIVLSIIPAFPLIHPGLPSTHDGPDHVARIMAFYQNLEDGILIPRWGAFLNWGYGHPILEFLYPLPSYIASIFHILGLSFFDATKLVFALGPILSFIFMYLWLKGFMARESSVLGAVLYSYAPYRFVDLYVRGDIGENLAFAFIPASLFFIYRLYKKKDYLNIILGSFSIGLLILSHNAIALITVPLIFLYGLYLWWNLKLEKKFIVNFLTLFILGFLLSLFFWLPALLEGKYTLRNIVTKGGYINSFVSLQKLVFGPWNFGGSGLFTVQLGIVQWISLVASPFLIYKYYIKKDKNFAFALVLLMFSLLAIFIMLPISNFLWSNIILLQNLQFPWRFLALTVFTTAVLGAYLIENVSKKYKKISAVILIIIVLVFSKNSIKANGYFYNLIHLENGIYKSTTDTGESSPIWSVRFMEKRPKAHLEVIDGDAQIKELERTSIYHKYRVKVIKDTLFGENTLYFPGWEIRANGNLINVEFQNMQYMGIMVYNLSEGDYIVEAKYSETKLRLMSDIISLVSILFIACFVSFKFVKGKHY